MTEYKNIKYDIKMTYHKGAWYDYRYTRNDNIFTVHVTMPADIELSIINSVQLFKRHVKHPSRWAWEGQSLLSGQFSENDYDREKLKDARVSKIVFKKEETIDNEFKY